MSTDRKRKAAGEPASTIDLLMKRPPWYKVAPYVFMLFLMFYGVWMIAYTASSFLHSRGDKEVVWSDLLEELNTLASVREEAGGQSDSLMERLAVTMGVRAGWIDPAGKERWYGNEPVPLSVEEIGESELRQVREGETIRLLNRPNPFRSGVATVARPVRNGEASYALFVQGEAPGFFHGFVKQLTPQLILNGILLILGIIAFAHGTPQRIRTWTTIIGALNRISKGDFNVHLDIDTVQGRKVRKPRGNRKPRRERRDGGNHNDLVYLTQSINDMASGLKKIEWMRQEFVSNVSHEIQSPLTSIGGFARALRSSDLSREARDDYLSIIETETDRLSRLSDNLLKLTSLDSARHPFERKRYRLDKQIRRIVLACEPQWESKKLEMDIELEPCELVADEDLMSQVWMNLLHNAVKFTPEGGTIRIGIAEARGAWTVTVSDTGIGLSEEDRLHVFERFFKADKSRSRSEGGSGLGLAIVKKIVDMHGGTIRMDSQAGEGTTVTVTLPAGAPPE
ncbi:HAMP domain-containing sensor histidine kinase [Paenibacillus hodogayensis]|uniref:histidine kinase n=1 Tax=Paenibacillus hodogayensis TaxID=279208 RepID=A0ABV5W6N2_9BACL